MENVGRRDATGGEERGGDGEDGGVDLNGASEDINGDFFGLEVGSRVVSREHGESLAAASLATPSLSSELRVESTRLRFAGGSSSCSECFFCRE